MIRLAVTGGRTYHDRGHVWRTLDWLHRDQGVDVLLAGDAPGADELAIRWASARGIPFLRFRADWPRHGLAAGPIRNQEMLDVGKPDMVLAFPGGRGTEDMVRRATMRGLDVLRTVRS